MTTTVRGDHLRAALSLDERALAEFVLADTGASGVVWYGAGDGLVSCAFAEAPTKDELEELVRFLLDTLHHQYGLKETPDFPEADIEESAVLATTSSILWRKIIPVGNHGSCLGGLALFAAAPVRIADDEAIALAFSIAFRLKRQRRMIDEISNRLDDIAQVGRILATVGEPERTLSRVLELCVLASGAEVGGIVRRSATGVFSIGIPIESLTGVRFSNGDSLVDLALRAVDQRKWNTERLRAELVPEGTPLVLDTLLILPLTFEAESHGAMILINQPEVYLESATYIASLSTIAHLAAAALTMEERQAQKIEQELMRQELKAAATIQQSLLPKQIPDIRGITIRGVSRPSRSVGGDFYDFFALGVGKLGVMIADVSGKGIPASLLMATARSYLRVLAPRHQDSPARALERLTALLAGEIADNKFITANYLIIDAVEKKVVSANAGHHSPIFLSGAGVWTTECSGIPLGIFPDAEYEDETIPLSASTTIVLYTDGIIEVRNEANEIFGADRLKHSLARNHRLEPSDLLDRIWQDTVEFSHDGAPADDWTSVAIRYEADRSE